MIDRYGQYIHAQWPEKIHSDSDLAAARQHEAAAIDARPAPASWDRYGGWADGPQLEATGFFRTEKYDGKWFLVDPEGKLFFSIQAEPSLLLWYLPTLSVLPLVENAVKHNLISRQSPLYIDIYTNSDNQLVVSNRV